MTLQAGRAAVCLFLIVLLQSGVACAPKGTAVESEATHAAVVAVRVATVEERSVSAQVIAQGQWRVANDLAVTAPFSAIVESLQPRPGDPVRQGATMGMLVTRESRAAVRGAELMLRQANDPGAREEAQRAITQARRELVRVPLIAAASGVVSRRGVEPGAEVAEGTEILRIVSVRDLVFEAHVALADVARAVVGRSATVAMEGGGVIRAVVQRRLPITNAADQSALVWLAPATDVPLDVLERFGTATIETGTPRRVRMLPDSAVVADDLTGDLSVARIDPSGIAIWTPVRLGQALGGWHELLAPALRAGTPVVISGQRGLPDSARVRVLR